MDASRLQERFRCWQHTELTAAIHSVCLAAIARLLTQGEICWSSAQLTLRTIRCIGLGN